MRYLRGSQRFYSYWHYPKQHDQCAPTFGFSIKVGTYIMIGVSLQGFYKDPELYPYKNMAYLTFWLFNKRLNFRIGIQNKTWLYVRCEQFKVFCNSFSMWWHWLYTKYIKSSKGDELPF
jgi:hypothetical protein